MATSAYRQATRIGDQRQRTALLISVDDCILQMSDLFTLTKGELEERDRQLDETSKQLTQTKHELQQTMTDRNEQKHLVGEHVKAEKVLLNQAKKVSSFVTCKRNHDILFAVSSSLLRYLT